MLDDLILGAAMALTLAFAATAFLGLHGAAAWFAGGLAIVGLIRLAQIVIAAVSPHY